MVIPLEELARRNRGGLQCPLPSSQIFAKVDLLLIDNDSE